jgi:hypothetical protein
MGLYQNINEDVNANAFVNLQDGAGNSIASTSNALNVYITNGIEVGVADKASFTYGTSIFQPVGGVYQDTAPTLTAGTSGAVRLTQYRAYHMNLRDSSGNELGNVNAGGVFVRPGDGTNAQAFASSGEAFATIRQNSNVANVNASNQLLVLDGNAGSILDLMKPATATLSQVVLSTTSQTALALNASRKGMVFVNDSNKLIYIAFSATATTSAYTYKMQPQSTLVEEESRVYTGVVSVIGATGVTGNLVVTELT